jgi:hypothetical protein
VLQSDNVVIVVLPHVVQSGKLAVPWIQMVDVVALVLLVD